VGKTAESALEVWRQARRATTSIPRRPQQRHSPAGDSQLAGSRGGTSTGDSGMSGVSGEAEPPGATVLD
jgi:hypothetical protein